VFENIFVCFIWLIENLTMKSTSLCVVFKTVNYECGPMPYHSALFVLFLNLQALTHLKSGLATQLYNYSWVAVPKNKEVPFTNPS